MRNPPRTSLQIPCVPGILRAHNGIDRESHEPLNLISEICPCVFLFSLLLRNGCPLVPHRCQAWAAVAMGVIFFVALWGSMTNFSGEPLSKARYASIVLSSETTWAFITSTR